MKKILPVLCCVALLFAACSLSKTPAQVAIKTAEGALKAVSVEAQKYVPDQLASVEAALSDARDQFEKGDYKAALAGARDLPLKVKDLAVAVESRKAELPRIWEGMAASLPKLITETKAAIASARSADQAVIASAKDEVKGMEASLAKATEAFKSGDLLGAVNIGTEMQNLAAKIKASLMSPVVQE
ncbi:MAG: hypothetical protein A2509_00210 [Candidatus Edwardsbacteria bacterium RIFOXYD12_FULL_50_11]|uniref:DUF4398 domain-containing protein n=1 Tax=Candidatus Edwardsbacteria bacterium GWF2_54_11 TaxID=1817851 RepID=A0A1F5RC00_9BACT|nr:MAG: hypothetical protein A2502_07870 [Candidatus Edwardsbacteria bacterium RifOxyC12_full_54_24]OGF07486.1 MAG: hypothetical protein A2273_03190 [Candidatus Edwardsbacteria bacterium RifOxyA12_full_54_48]OGF09736.1 MAG: hypothetical protein A3K15_09600 [Candidatus Edwardsbacteria bacterium GWE2_54_12]OGF11999.1 MAG: hypothetical protein A2024_03155 [Candidatus Edwardsbacteria bacterium GWF2_54_11]OGF16684.1 MAG: hypothetical protein A2509_00210 [Candidatus Edwardsbacteria bacterium RIFOXYD1